MSTIIDTAGGDAIREAAELMGVPGVPGMADDEIHEGIRLALPNIRVFTGLDDLSADEVAEAAAVCCPFVAEATKQAKLTPDESCAAFDLISSILRATWAAWSDRGNP